MSLHLPLNLVLAAALVAPVHASDDLAPFPLRASAPAGTDVAQLASVPELVGDLVGRDAVTFADVALPGVDAPVTLDLERVHLALADDALHVDGALVGGDLSHLHLSMWSGAVRGRDGSDVFLSFSDVGSRGWITLDDETFHLGALPGPDGDWTRASAAFVRQSMLGALGIEPQLQCGADRVHHDAEPSLPQPHDGAQQPGYLGSLPLYGSSIALETDWQFHEVFGDLAAAQAYAASLFGAVADRYRDQVGVILTLPYLAFYTSNDDGWDSQDNGGNSIDALYEFQDAWDGGAAPVPADLYTMWSGADLGGGVAYLDVLCNQDYGFSVSGNLAGQTPLPVLPNNALNWDFMVTAHELGHNVASPHTHDYCPPIDQCAPDGYFGDCQSSQVCTPVGTIMSYCHLCDGGLENVTTFFAPAVADLMRDGVETSCATLFAGVFVDDLGASLAGSAGAPALDATFGGSTLALEMTDLAPGASGVLYLGFTDVSVPFKGGTLVPSPDIALTFGVSSSTVTLAGPVSGFPTGLDLVAQAWFKDGPGLEGFSATNAIALELIVP